MDDEVNGHRAREEEEMRHEPDLKEDAKNLTLVTGSGILAAVLTMGLLASRMNAAPKAHIHHVQPVVVELSAEPVVVEVEPIVLTPRSGSNRLYGTVRTEYGSEFTGFIRWDRNEGSWADLLDANKPRTRGGSSISGIRFGHVQRIDVLGRDAARFTLRSGDQVELTGNASDLGSGLRALLVDEGDGTVAEFEWSDLDAIEFTAPPEGVRPSEGRLFGTLVTRSGLEFTGYVAWDVDEIYSSDILDGNEDGERREVPFGAIASIERQSSWASLVTLRDGRRMVLEGTNDVDASISGISVSDPALGQVKLDWDEFERVRFHGTDDEARVEAFDGGSRLHGTVLTVSGDELSGDIVWDGDEAFTWEMLNGELDDVDFSVEFGKIASIARLRDGAAVTLNDGRVFELSDSNDVDDGNRGIVISTDGREYEVEWNDFVELRLHR